MKTLVYKQTVIAAAFLLSAFTLSAQEVKKEYHKEYQAQQGDVLRLNNRYGDISISSSNSDAIVVDVVVALSYSSQERAEKLISYINIDFQDSDGSYSVTTNISNEFNYSGWGKTDKKFSITYNVSMPEWLDATIINKYGDINTEALSGHVNIDLKYGNLNALGFSRGNEKPVNTISVSYGKAVINDAGWLDFSARYATGVEISNIQALALDSRYSKITVSKASSIVINSKYDKYSIGDVRNIVVDCAYSDYDISTISKKLDIDCEYGSFSANNITESFQSIDVVTRYCNVSIPIAEGAAYNLKAYAKYGRIEYDKDNFDSKKQIIQNNSMELEGVVNSFKSSIYGQVNIDSSYGNVRLF